MTTPIVIRRSLVAATKDVTGAAVVIDTFRAFTTAAFLLARGVPRIVLTETLDEARDRSTALPGSILCGEEDGRKPDDFTIGNSPVTAASYPDVDGRTVVMRTSAGTRGVVGALRSGAGPVYAASLVVAGATAQAVRGERSVTIIASGLGGTVVADEDEETADLIEALISGDPPDPGYLRRIRAGAGAHRLTTTPWIDPADLDLCLATDRFDFALTAVLVDGVATLTRS